MSNDIKQWITDNLQYSRGLISKKCKQEWFIKYGFSVYWEEIHKSTQFLDVLNPTFPQRIWHIINNNNSQVKCANPSCQNIPTFWSFNIGYLRTCSSSCAQYDPLTKEKIKTTNLQKYGVEYGLQNKDIKQKRFNTLMEKYGVENISQVDGISEKKQNTCLKNHGTKWFLENANLIHKYVKEKYGVDNVQQLPHIKQKRIDTRMGNFYDSLFITNRLNGAVVPLFSKSEYINGGLLQKYSFECIKCKTHFNDCLEDGDVPRCPQCYKNSSVFEKEITDYIKSLLPTEKIEENIKTILSNNYELDIYIPFKNIAIECNGLFWHGELGGNKGKSYHLSKTIECEAKGIRLIHIFEDEWILVPNIVKNRLRHILNCNNDTIYARNCEIRDVSFKDKNIFLEKYHIQGNDKSKIKIGLYYNDELVAIMTFGNKRIFMNIKSADDEYELIRYATSKSVIGGASKMLSYFIKTYHPKKIISYADRRWTYSRNNLYEKIGFKKISSGTPNYWYFGRDGNYKRFHRYGFAKHTLSKRLASFDPTLSEWENMKNNGWDRIWDCGNLKYEMNI